MLALAAVLATLHLTGEVPVAGGDYLLVPFELPAGTVELTVAHDDGSPAQILDWGVWSPDGFRGWGGGLTEPAVIGVAESSRGYLAGAITPGTWYLVIGKAQLGGNPGHYTLDVEARDVATLTPGPRAPWATGIVVQERRWYAGDFHVHSQDSGDAGATLDQIVDLARARGLDFVVISDHNTVAQHPRQAARQATLDDLLLVRGAEITTYHGHANAFGIDRYVDHRVGLDGVSARTIADTVAAEGGALIVNHPELDVGDACIGCAWRHDDTPWDEVAGIEIQTGNADLTSGVFTPRAIARWDALADAGHLLAAIGGSDDHRAGRDTGPGAARIGSPTTMVLAQVLSEPALVEAVRSGRTVVKLHGPDDPMVELTAIDEGRPPESAGIGECLQTWKPFELVAVVTGARAEGANAELWSNGRLVAAAPVTGGTVRFPREPIGGIERYRIELYVDGARATVTSHVVVESELSTCGAPDCIDTGCCDAGGDAGPGAALAGLVVGLALRRRRRALV